MAFIHIRVNKNSPSMRVYFKLDGWENELKFGKYMEVDDGRHVLKFEGESTVWTVAETLDSDQLLEIVVDGDGMGLVSCAPQYSVRDLDEAKVNMIRETLAIEKEEAEQKSKKIGKWVMIIGGIWIGGAILVGLIVGIANGLPLF